MSEQDDYNYQLSAEVDAWMRIMARELHGKEDELRDAAYRISDAMKGNSFAIALAALGVALLTMARSSPNPDAVVVLTCENCINSLHACPEAGEAVH